MDAKKIGSFADRQTVVIASFVSMLNRHGRYLSMLNMYMSTLLKVVSSDCLLLRRVAKSGCMQA